MAKDKTKIFSVFGQIESIVARAMAAQKLANVIEPEHIPLSARYNEEGDRALCAVVISLRMEQEFDRRVSQLRM